MTKSAQNTHARKYSVLDAILAEKRQDVSRLRQSDIAPRERRRPVSLASSLKQPGPGFILECKRASPSRGLIRGHYQPEKIADIYSPYANAISVLTDKTFFKGSLQDLINVGKRTSLPLLAKDFFIDHSQVAKAYAAGADAILLMLSILDDDAYRDLSQVAFKLGMEVLTEVHSEDELDRANDLGASLIGINNRNLNTLEVNIETTAHLAQKVRPSAVVISESGYSDRSQILSNASLVDGFLIGSSIMAAPHMDIKVRQLVFGEVKICGLTRPEDAAFAYKCGAIYGGLNFVTGTPRCLSSAQAKIVKKGSPLKWVGVFRDSAPDQIARISRLLDLDVVQLHGSETNDFRKYLRKNLPGDTKIWQAVEGENVCQNTDLTACDRTLLDTRLRSVFGGTGQIFNWDNLLKLNRKDHLGLAGGLQPSNIRQAINTGIPLLDVCSGVEDSPGIKSREKLAKLFKAIRTMEGTKHD